MNRVLAALCACVFAGLIGQIALAAEDNPAKQADSAKNHSETIEQKIPEAKIFVTQHKGRVGATTMSYTATAGTMLMKNDNDAPIAFFGFTAYMRDGVDSLTRSIVVAYNGGPPSNIWMLPPDCAATCIWNSTMPGS